MRWLSCGIIGAPLALVYGWSYLRGARRVARPRACHRRTLAAFALALAITIGWLVFGLVAQRGSTSTHQPHSDSSTPRSSRITQGKRSPGTSVVSLTRHTTRYSPGS